MAILAFFTQETVWMWDVVNGIVIPITLIAILWTLWLQRASHVVATLDSVYARWNSEPMLRARRRVCSSWIDGKFNFEGDAEAVAELIEDLGNYAHARAIPGKTLWNGYSWYVEHYWVIFREGIYKIREDYGDSSIYERFESLLVTFIESSDRRGLGACADKSDDVIRRFCEGEIRLTNSLDADPDT